MSLQTAAVVTIKHASAMTRKGRNDIAKWLRQHASWLEKYGDQYSGRFTGRYYYEDKKK